MKSPVSKIRCKRMLGFAPMMGLASTVTLFLLNAASATAQQEVLPHGAQFEYVEQWTAEFPPTEFPQPRADLEDKDVILYHQTPDGKREGSKFEFYLMDKQTGQYLSKAEVDVGLAYDDPRVVYSVKGELAYKGNYWIVLGQKEEIDVGSFVVVLNYRSGAILQSFGTLRHLDAYDFAANMVPVGDYVYTTGLVDMGMPSAMPRGGLNPFVAAYNAETGAAIGRVYPGYFEEEYQPDLEVFEGLKSLQGQTVMIGTFPIVVAEDTLEYIPLKNTTLGVYNIGLPHIILPLTQGFYLAGWYYDYFTQHSAPVSMRSIKFARLYRWNPGSEPELVQDSLIDTGVHYIGGALQGTRYWMYDDHGVIHIFDTNQLNHGETHPGHKVLPNSPATRVGNEKYLVLNFTQGEFGPAIMLGPGSIHSLNLYDAIEFEKDDFDRKIYNTNVLGRSTESKESQKVLTFGSIRTSEP